MEDNIAKQRTFCACLTKLVFFLIFVFSLPACRNSSVDQDRDQYLDWFREVKYGMFIHWGPYSRLEGEWNGRHISPGDNAEWIMKRLQIPVNEYREMAHDFVPEKFNADDWVSLAKAAGMKYIVITAKHHDGFAMYRSEVSDYNIAEWTAFDRDPLRELSEACRREGIKFCVYYSHREDWDHPGGYGNNWDYDNDWGDTYYHPEKFEQYIEEKAKPQIRELLTNYGPIGLVWFDRGMYTPEQGMDFVNLVYGLQPATLINSRVGHYSQDLLGDYQSMADNGMPPGGLGEYWETPMTLNGTWGFNKYDSTWKSPETVIMRLVEIVSRGGNYLLNVGPDGLGKIPDITIDILKIAGNWLNRNSESIYGTNASPFGELSWGYCTTKDDKIYLFIRDWPQQGTISLPGLKNEVSSAWLLSQSSVKIMVKQTGSMTEISLPHDPADHPLTVVVLETKGIPETYPGKVSPDTTGSIVLDYSNVVTRGNTKTRFNRKGGFHISKWKGPEDYAEWTISTEKASAFRIDIDYSAKKEWEGKNFEITIGTHVVKSTVKSSPEYFVYNKFPAGYIELPGTGEYKVIIKPVLQDESYLMYLRSIVLEPVISVKKGGWSIN